MEDTDNSKGNLNDKKLVKYAHSLLNKGNMTRWWPTGGTVLRSKAIRIMLSKSVGEILFVHL